MNKIEIYNKLVELFNLTKVEEKFEDNKLKDGSIIRGDLQAGAVLNLIAEDGTMSVLPDGECELADGRKIVIKDGVVDSILDAVTEVMVDETVVPSADVTVAPTDTETPAEDAVESMLPQIVADLADRIGALEEALSKMTMANTEMSETITKLAAQPAAEPIKRTTVGDAFSMVQTKEDYFSKLEAMSSYRK